MSNNQETALSSTRLRKLMFNARFGSWCGALFFTFWIAQRIYFNLEQHFAFTFYALAWWLITLQYCIFVTSYLTRYEAKQKAQGFLETVFPFICAALPFLLIVDFPFRPQTYDIACLRFVSTSFVIGGTLVVIAGIISLRKSFSIMTEVRKPVMKGIYRMTRHPMYVGSMITALGTLFQNWGLWNCLVFVVFCIFQVYRATREEIKIGMVFSEYGDYISRVGWLWKIGRRRLTPNEYVPGK
jgi:protein-S-isoprenylcysteine O-methyltransferase Ste14